LFGQPFIGGGGEQVSQRSKEIRKEKLMRVGIERYRHALGNRERMDISKEEERGGGKEADWFNQRKEGRHSLKSLESNYCCGEERKSKDRTRKKNRTKLKRLD